MKDLVRSILIAVVMAVLFLGCTIFTFTYLSSQAHAYNYLDPDETIGRCAQYGAVTAALLTDFRKGGDVGVRWLESKGMTERMREIFTPVIGVLLKNHTTMDEADARMLGRDACLDYFKAN